MWQVGVGLLLLCAARDEIQVHEVVRHMKVAHGYKIGDAACAANNDQRWIRRLRHPKV